MRKELGRYKWKVDRAGKTTNEPVDTWNHLIDPLRYVALNKLKINTLTTRKSRLPFRENNWQNKLADFITI